MAALHKMLLRRYVITEPNDREQTSLSVLFFLPRIPGLPVWRKDTRGQLGSNDFSFVLFSGPLYGQSRSAVQKKSQFEGAQSSDTHRHNWLSRLKSHTCHLTDSSTPPHTHTLV